MFYVVAIYTYCQTSSIERNVRIVGIVEWNVLLIAVFVNKCPTRCNYTQFILSVNCSTYFGWFLHPSSGAQISVFTASGTSQLLLLPVGIVGGVETVHWHRIATHGPMNVKLSDSSCSRRQSDAKVTAECETYVAVVSRMSIYTLSVKEECEYIPGVWKNVNICTECERRLCTYSRDVKECEQTYWMSKKIVNIESGCETTWTYMLNVKEDFEPIVGVWKNVNVYTECERRLWTYSRCVKEYEHNAECGRRMWTYSRDVKECEPLFRMWK